MMDLSPWKITVADGGHDGLLPGRYIARSYAVDPKVSAYGTTPEVAVVELKRLLAEKYPLCHWYQDLPWEMLPGFSGVVFCPRD